MDQRDLPTNQSYFLSRGITVSRALAKNQLTTTMATKPIFSLLFCIFILASSNLAQPQINVWPKPVTAVYQTPNAVLLSPSLTIHHPPHNHLRQAVRRYLRLISTEKWHPIRHFPVTLSTSPPLQTLTISVSDTSTPLQHGVDESYTLSISGNSVAGNLTSATVWGAMRGLETLSQLVWGNPAKIPADLYISDRPLFPHRGLVLDTSRNFYPVRDILRTIRAMSYNKMNVLHWHITDSHSFPVVLPSVPELGRKGSYGLGMQYFPADVRKIVEFGFRHGVRILPEIDVPGHTGSWAEAYPDIVTCANMFWWRPGADRADRLASEPGTGQLNPLNTKTYEVLRNVIHDVTTLFPESFYHSGADEIAPACWKTDPAIQTFLSNGGTVSQLLETFINTTHRYIVNVNRTAVYWEDVLLDGDVRVGPSVIPRETTILQTWNEGPNNTKRITAAGYRTIVSSSDFYYLDCGHGGFVGNDSRYDRQISDDPGIPFNYKGGNGGSWCAPFKTWQRIYDYDITYGLNEQEAKLVLGGETALWSEQADATVLDARVWPRSSAMAEALWSGNRDGKGKKRYAEAMDRLNEWRYRMVGRGIMAEPLQPMWCLTHPGMCNLDQ